MFKADRNVFQQLLWAKDAGWDINLRDILKHELAPMPLSLDDTAGKLWPTNKAVLGNILHCKCWGQITRI
jgi:hypothetical protein